MLLIWITKLNNNYVFLAKIRMEMLVNHDLLAISIPFSAGVILAAYLPQGELSLYIAASLACTALFICVSYLAVSNDTRPVMLAFFFAGLLSCWTSRSGYHAGHLHIQASEAALRALISHIENIDFSNEETGALIRALLCGDKSQLDPDLSQAFRRSGASHILALSGLHMGIIYGILSKLLFFFGNSIKGRALRSIVIIASCAFYTMMTSASDSVVRAFLFIFLNETAALFPGRRKSSLGIFCTALMIQLCISPLSAKSIAFQLSYSAMLGIYLIFPILKSWLPQNAGRLPGIIWRSCALSISCQIFTAPLVYIYFGSFPKMFLLTNLLSLPLTESFIVLAVISLAMSGLGWYPETIKGMTEFLGQALIYCIETIASIS